MSWRDAKIARAAEVERNPKQPAQQTDIVREAKRILIARAMSEDEADRFLFDLLSEPQQEAMRRHYQAGEPRESVDAWYAAQVRAKLAAEGLTAP